MYISIIKQHKELPQKGDKPRGIFERRNPLLFARYQYPSLVVLEIAPLCRIIL
jgi:hypothetical protein